MATQLGVILVKGQQLLLGQPAQRPQGDVQGTGRMSLGKDESVVGIHDPMVQGQQHVERGEVAADVTDAALEVHLEQAQPRLLQDFLQRNFPVGVGRMGWFNHA